MRRRTFSRKKTDVELFPFLSILACTIGTLILLIIVLTTQMLNKQDATAKESEASGNQQEVKIVAKESGKNGQNKTKNPRYIECRGDGVILYPNKIFVPQAELSSFNSPLQELISLIKINKDQEYLIIAVRPDGIDVFKEVRSLVEGAEIDIGYEPIDEDWQLAIGETTIDETQR